MDIGNTWNGWTIESLIGEGSYGKVYRIAKTEFGRTYESALKVIRIPQNESEYRSTKSEGLDDDSITLYYRGVVEDIVSECALMYEMKGNSNIVSYEGHQVVELKDSFGWEIYIQMELLTPIIKYMSEHHLSEAETIKMGIDICKALEICSRYNIIHRDIKPENIFISKQGNYKLGDFGIARRMEGATAGMSRKGTITYMAPEVFGGKPYNATVDTYSLGIMLYRFVNNNRTPFLPPYPEKIKYSDKEKANQLRMKGEPLPAPSEASPGFAAVILKACSFDPHYRYKTPTEMRSALESLAVSENSKSYSFSDDSEEDAATLPLIQSFPEEDGATLPLIQSIQEDDEETIPLDITVGEEKEKTLPLEESIEVDSEATLPLIQSFPEEDAATLPLEESFEMPYAKGIYTDHPKYSGVSNEQDILPDFEPNNSTDKYAYSAGINKSTVADKENQIKTVPKEKGSLMRAVYAVSAIVIAAIVMCVFILNFAPDSGAALWIDSIIESLVGNSYEDDSYDSDTPQSSDDYKSYYIEGIRIHVPSDWTYQPGSEYVIDGGPEAAHMFRCYSSNVQESVNIQREGTENEYMNYYSAGVDSRAEDYREILKDRGQEVIDIYDGKCGTVIEYWSDAELEGLGDYGSDVKAKVYLYLIPVGYKQQITCVNYAYTIDDDIDVEYEETLKDTIFNSIKVD